MLRFVFEIVFLSWDCKYFDVQPGVKRFKLQFLLPIKTNYFPKMSVITFLHSHDELELCICDHGHEKKNETNNCIIEDKWTW